MNGKASLPKLGKHAWWGACWRYYLNRRSHFLPVPVASSRRLNWRVSWPTSSTPTIWRWRKKVSCLRPLGSRRTLCPVRRRKLCSGRDKTESVRRGRSAPQAAIHNFTLIWPCTRTTRNALYTSFEYYCSQCSMIYSFVLTPRAICFSDVVWVFILGLAHRTMRLLVEEYMKRSSSKFETLRMQQK